MARNEDIRVEVVCALPRRQSVIALTLPAGTTARTAVKLSGFASTFPEIDVDRALIGIFGRRVASDMPLKNGDRVEIYRALTADPKEARRRRARKPQ